MLYVRVQDDFPIDVSGSNIFSNQGYEIAEPPRNNLGLLYAAQSCNSTAEELDALQ
jgi:hypothetical protein